MHIAGKIIDHLSTRGPEASSCPSDVARALIDDEMAWRTMMPAMREAASPPAAMLTGEPAPTTMWSRNLTAISYKAYLGSRAMARSAALGSVTPLG